MCIPGKRVTLSAKEYITNGVECSAISSWRSDGCLVTVRTSATVEPELLAIKPVFSYFPPDITIDTGTNHLPGPGVTHAAGQPVVRSFCGK